MIPLTYKMINLRRLISVTTRVAITLASLIGLLFAMISDIFDISTTNLLISPSNINNPYNFDIPKAASTLLEKDSNNAGSRLLSNITAVDLGLADDYKIGPLYYCSSFRREYGVNCFETQYDIRPIIENVFFTIGQDVALPNYVWSEISDLSCALIKAKRCLCVSFVALILELCCVFIRKPCRIFSCITFFITFTKAISLCVAASVATKIQFLTVVLNTSYGVEVAYNIVYLKTVRISAACAIGTACFRFLAIYSFFRRKSSTQNRRSEKAVKLIPEKSHKL